MFFSTQQQKHIASLERQVKDLEDENYRLRRANEWNLAEKILPQLNLDLPDEQRRIKCIVGLSDNCTQEAWFCCDKNGSRAWWMDSDEVVIVGRKVVVWRIMPSFPSSLTHLY